MGGTIGSSPDGRKVDGDALVAAIPAIKTIADVKIENVAAVGSSSLSFADWSRLVARIRSAFAEDPGLAGVVVTHGTDTMEETAFLLDLVIADPRPVVVTGSMRQTNAVSADGPANILEAITVAASPAAANRGVLVVLDDQIHAAAAVSKTNTTRLSTFVSLDQGPEGMVSSASGLHFFHAPGRTGRIYPLAPDTIAHLPRVDIVTSYFGGDDALLSAAAARAKGVVIAGFGSGTMTPSVDAAASAAASAGLPVVLAARVPSGPVHDGSYGAAQRPPSFVRSGFLNPAKARVLLMVYLASQKTARGDLSLQSAFEPY
jgi:L-asparaginase